MCYFEENFNKVYQIEIHFHTLDFKCGPLLLYKIFSRIYFQRETAHSSKINSFKSLVKEQNFPLKVMVVKMSYSYIY